MGLGIAPPPGVQGERNVYIPDKIVNNCFPSQTSSPSYEILKCVSRATGLQYIVALAGNPTNYWVGLGHCRFFFSHVYKKLFLRVEYGQLSQDL